MLREPRLAYKPFHYPEAFEFFTKQQQSHWLPTEVSMSSDLRDFAERLTPSEKFAVTTVLRLFTQLEINIEDYWTSKVTRWFPHAEIQQMASTFGAFEAIHIWAYSYLNDSLGMSEAEYSAFQTEPSMMAKIERLTSRINSDDTDAGIAQSLAIFSAFTEGVSLFSSFAILLNFSRFNKLRSLGQIVSWSIRDESLHSQAGCWLFRTFIKEKPELWTDELKQAIYQAARDTVALEDDYIDKVFEQGPIEGLTAKNLKTYIRHRANTKLGDLGCKMNWKNLDKSEVEAVTSWFDLMAAGVEHADFFASRVSSYSKGHIDWSTVWNDYQPRLETNNA